MLKSTPLQTAVTFSRQGEKQAVAANGGFITVSEDEIAYHFDPLTGERTGVFIDAEQTVNHARDSEALESRIAGTFEPVAHPIFGSIGKLGMIDSTAGATYRAGWILHPNNDPAGRGRAFRSFIAKAGTITRLYAHSWSNQGDAYQLLIDLTTGEVTKNHPGSPDWFGSIPLRDGFWLYWWIRDLTEGYASRGFTVGADVQHYGPFTAGDYFYFGKPTAVPQGWFTHYIPTPSDADITRYAETLTETPLFNSFEDISYFIDLVPYYDMGSGGQVVLVSNRISGTQYLRLDIDPTGARDGQVALLIRGPNGVQVRVESDINAAVPGKRMKIGFSLLRSGRALLAVNGVLYDAVYDQLPEVASTITLQQNYAALRRKEYWTLDPLTAEELIHETYLPT